MQPPSYPPSSLPSLAHDVQDESAAVDDSGRLTPEPRTPDQLQGPQLIDASPPSSKTVQERRAKQNRGKHFPDKRKEHRQKHFKSHSEGSENDSSNNEDTSPLLPFGHLPSESYAETIIQQPLSNKAKGKQRALETGVAVPTRTQAALQVNMAELQVFRESSSPPIRIPKFDSSEDQHRAEQWTNNAAPRNEDGDSEECRWQCESHRRSSFDPALLKPAPWRRHPHAPSISTEDLEAVPQAGGGGSDTPKRAGLRAFIHGTSGKGSPAPSRAASGKAWWPWDASVPSLSTPSLLPTWDSRHSGRSRRYSHPEPRVVDDGVYKSAKPSLEYHSGVAQNAAPIDTHQWQTAAAAVVDEAQDHALEGQQGGLDDFAAIHEGLVADMKRDAHNVDAAVEGQVMDEASWASKPGDTERKGSERDGAHSLVSLHTIRGCTLPCTSAGEASDIPIISTPSPSATRNSNYFTLFLDGARGADWSLLLVGTLAALASGIPLPIIGVLFGELIDGFNSVSCSSAQERALMDTKELLRLLTVRALSFAQDASPQALPPDEQAAFLANVVVKVKLILAAAAANFLLIWIYTVCWSLVGERLVRRLREKYLRSVLRQEMAFFDLAKPGEIATRLSADLLTIQVGTSEKCGIMLSSLSYFFTSFIVAFIKLPVLAAQLLSLLPAFAIISLIGSKYVGRFSTLTSTHLSHASSLATEALGNLAVVQVFNAEEKLTRIYAKHLEAARKSGLRKAIAASCMLGCLFFVGYSANALAFYSGSKIIAQRLRDGVAGAGVGSVYTVIFLLLDASFIIGQIAPYMQTFSQASAAGKGLFSVINRPSRIDAMSTTHGLSTDPSALSGISVSFRSVTFSYPSRPSQNAADAMDLEVDEGQKVGICGPSGSGKSTVVALACRLYDPAEGQVLINGIPATELNPRWLRSQIGIVSQDPVLFDGTIFQAVALGLHGSVEYEELWPALKALSTGQISEKDPGTFAAEMAQIKSLVRHAADLANARGFIEELEDGYDTRVGEGGARLSGGQKVRISLARAIVKRPKLLICDEATAALDPESEKLVQEAFDHATEGRTVISVAHRLASIKGHDKIVVVSAGKVIEQGSHDELIANKGAYYSLAAAQDTRKVDGGADETDAPEPHQRQAPVELNGAEPVDQAVGSIKVDHTPNGTHKSPGVWIRLAAACRPELLFACIGVFTSTVIGSAYSGEAFIFGNVIDALNPCKGIPAIRANADFFALMFFVLALIELFSYSINGSSFGKMAEALLYRLRRLSFLALLRQKQSWFENDDRSPSTIVSSLAADAAALGGLTSTVIGTVCAIGVNLVVGLIVSFIVSWRIAIVLVWTVPLMMAAGYMRLKVLADFQRRHATAYRGANAIAVEAVNNIGTVQGLGSESDVCDRFQHALITPYREGLRHIFVGNVFLAGALSLSYFIYGFAYYWGSRMVVAGYATQIDFFIVLPALLFSAQASGQLLSFSSEFAHAQSSAQHIFSIIDQSSSSRELHSGSSEKLWSDKPSSTPSRSLDEESWEGNGVSTPAGPMAISCQGIYFAYPSRKDPVLRGVTFDVAPGSFVALVGPSGSGKSTFFALLTKLYKPTSGTIRINNRLIEDIPADRLRRDIAIVPQEPTLFYGTIRFNVALGARDEQVSPSAEDADCVPLEEVIAACKMANIHDTIMTLPEQYNTLVGLKGGQLSGGQRQRLALARALLRKPKLLLLDEASSALDAESERIFQQTLQTIVQSRSCTIVSINHRMATIKDVDYLYIFNRGTIVACGTHAHLMRTSERFRAMVSHQSLL